MSVNITKAVVPAAGMGTRMRPITSVIPKELLPIGVKPVIHRVLDELAAVGIASVVIVLSPRKPIVREYLDGQRFPMSIAHVYQETPRGLGDAVLCAQEAVGDEPFAVALGDCAVDSPTLGSPLRRLCEAANATGGSAVLCEEVDWERVTRYGVLAPAEAANGTFRLRGIVEKPPQDRAPSNLVVAGRYVLQPEVFDYLERTAPDSKGEVQLTGALAAMIADGRPFSAVRLEAGEERLDIGAFRSYIHAFNVCAQRDLANGEC